MNVLISGSTGLIGSRLVSFLTPSGNQVVRLVRGEAKTDGEVSWNPETGEIDASKLEEIDAVVHLAGENIAGRWSNEKKRKIRDSRVIGTRLLAETIVKLKSPPRVFACASAIGYYGDHGDEVLTEQSAPGDDFLAGVCREWEAATKPASDKGVRVINLRFGVVLSRRGGALAKMLLPFKLGAGGIVGDGKQYWSWIALDDVVGAIGHALKTDALQGPVNVVAPNPVTNREFTKTLGNVLHRPTIFPMPAFAARLAFGEMADALLLASQRVDSKKLVDSGYAFRLPDLEGALRSILES